MARNRGPKKAKRGKLNWDNRKANRGRKPAMGKKMHNPTWKEVRAHILRRATAVVPPSEAEAASN